MRASGTSVENSFVNGLVTEFTGLNFPENAVTDCDNCVFEKTGLVRRRLGIDFEDDFVENTQSITGAITNFRWDTVDNNGNRTFVVSQVGRFVFFYDVNGSSLSANKKDFFVDLAVYRTASTSIDSVVENKASFSYGDGYLFIAHRYCEPMYVKYDAATDDITVRTISIKVRDFEGLDDGLAVDFRPPTLSREHEYNMQNQGWYGTAIVKDVGTSYVLQRWGISRSDYPSNSDIWWQLKDSNDSVDFSFADRLAKGNTPSAKGHFILNAFDLDRAITSPSVNTAGTVEKTSSNGLRPEFTEFFAGRVWWSGVRTIGFGSKIYFSKVIESDKDFGACYQVNDPTSESISDLLPTDGGVILIPDIAETIYMKSIGNSLIIFATNGVWTISGADFSGFTADSFQVRRISDIGALSSYSFVSVEGSPIWWNVTGIYTITSDGSGSSASVVSITNDTIKDFFFNIPADSKKYCQGSYDKLTRVVTWVYRSSQANTFQQNFEYDRMLHFNVNTKAFYPYTVGNSLWKISGVINVFGDVSRIVQENVTNTALENVVNNVGSSVTADVVERFSIDSVTKFFATRGSKSTWAEEKDLDYVDWESSGTSVNYASYFISGYKLRGESQRDFQTNYISITSLVQTNSSFLLSGRWDYAINTSSNRVTTSQEGYTHKPNQKYSIKKLKLRGNGKVLQYKVESRQGKPFNIAGWVTFDTVNGGV